MKLDFKKIDSEKIKSCFKEVYSHFKPLHKYSFVLERKILPNSTMQAQPILDFGKLITGKRAYKISVAKHIKDSDTALVHDLPPKVMRGWFAHELGHVMDYEAHSNFGMIKFGLLYVFSKKYKKKAEYRADAFAIKYGFGEDIIEAKNYILSSPLFSELYQNIIRDYYMPADMVKQQMSALKN